MSLSRRFRRHGKRLRSLFGTPVVSGLRVAATSSVDRSDATAVICRCALVHTSAASLAAGRSLFAHIGNVGALTAERGLAQPAV